MFSTKGPYQAQNTRFWKFHFWLPMLFAVSVLSLFEFTSLDIVIADFWYQLEGGSWALRKNWFSYVLMHHWGKRLVISIGLILAMLLAASWKIERLRKWRWSLAISVIAMILLPTFVTTLKNLSFVPCPWDISLFGGTHPYIRTFDYTAATQAGHCFPAAHSSSGFALLSLYFAFSPFVTKNRYLLLVPGLVIGSSFGFAQQLRGAHFLSHDLWTATICWFGALLLVTLAWKLVPPQIFTNDRVKNNE